MHVRSDKGARGRNSSGLLPTWIEQRPYLNKLLVVKCSTIASAFLTSPCFPDCLLPRRTCTSETLLFILLLVLPLLLFFLLLVLLHLPIVVLLPCLLLPLLLLFPFLSVYYSDPAPLREPRLPHPLCPPLSDGIVASRSHPQITSNDKYPRAFVLPQHLCLLSFIYCLQIFSSPLFLSLFLLFYEVSGDCYKLSVSYF